MHKRSEAMSSPRLDYEWIPQRLLSVPDVAKLCGAAERTVWSWIELELLPVIRIGARKTRIEPDDLRMFLDARRQMGARTQEDSS